MANAAVLPAWVIEASDESAEQIVNSDARRVLARIAEMALLREPHAYQAAFIDCQAKRVIIRAGRRGGKTVGVATRAVRRFLLGRRQLYATPTQEQIDRFWQEVKRALAPAIDAGLLYKNETKHIIEIPKTEVRIRAKTAWNADTLRGDYADDLTLDEWQLMNEDTWGVVGAPMLIDNNGDAVFIYTPPSLHSRSASKADDPQHAAKLYRKHEHDESGRWATFHFSSLDNPFVSAEAIDELANDMTALAYRMEIKAEDVNEAPGALWKRDVIEANRVIQAPDLARIVVGVDPSATEQGDEAGIVVDGMARTERGDELYIIADESTQGSPRTWAERAVTAYYKYRADLVVAEDNNGGEMVELTIKTVDPNVRVKRVHASRGKATRAEPIAAIHEHSREHAVGSFPALEDELCLWTPGDKSPNRLDAHVWAATELMLSGGDAAMYVGSKRVG